MGTTRKRTRLTKSADFDRVYRQGFSVQHRMLVVYAFERPADADDDACRVGITVSRKVGSAVDRNTIKRQIREAIAQADVSLPGHDLVVIARPGLVETIDRRGFDWLVSEIRESAEALSDRENKRRSRS